MSRCNILPALQQSFPTTIKTTLLKEWIVGRHVFTSKSVRVEDFTPIESNLIQGVVMDLIPKRKAN